MSSRPLDTSPAAWSTSRAAFARMDGPTRARVAVALAEAVRDLRLAGIRARNPDLDEREVLTHLIAEDCGVDLAPGS